MNFKNTKKYIKILLSLAILDVSSWLVDYCPVGSRLSIRSASIACWQPHASILSLTLQLSFAFASRRTVEVDKWNLFKHELTAGQIEFSMQVCWCCRGRVDCCCSWFSPPPFHTFHYMGRRGQREKWASDCHRRIRWIEFIAYRTSWDDWIGTSDILIKLKFSIINSWLFVAFKSMMLQQQRTNWFTSACRRFMWLSQKKHQTKF